MNKLLIHLLLNVITGSLSAAMELEVKPEVILENAERVGINLGTWTTWGAEQLSKNVIMNPGFEGDIDRAIVITTQAEKGSFSGEAEWGYDDDYWKGALFEVRTGTAKGTTGKVTHSLRKGTHGRPQYFTEKPLPAIGQKEVITLTKISEKDPVPLWWIGEGSKGRAKVSNEEKRPLSPGSLSLALEPEASAPAEVDYYLDAIGERAGKQLPVEGPWRFSLWARTDTPGNTLHIFFRRLNGAHPFFEKIITPTEEWKEYLIDFEGHDNGEPQTLQLKIGAVGSKGRVWIDDVFLGPFQPNNPTAFRHAVVDLLQKIKPSFIRDTQGQLGDTLDNRLAPLLARKAASLRAFAGERSLATLYSIPDLLQLCKTVKANPWIVVPPTLSDEEAFLLGQYLSKHANKETFSAVAVEFGNENWNWLFRTTGIPYPPQHGQVAEAVFEQIEKGAAGQVSLRKVVNGQYASPRVSLEFLQSAPAADTLAIAPYFFYTLNSGGTLQDNLENMFKSDKKLLEETANGAATRGKKLAAYEVNLHTTKGSAAGEERDSYVAGQAAGAALAKRLLEGMLLGIEPEIVFSLAQFDTDIEGGKGKVKLWGIARDLGATNRIRPQGLAVIMLNAVIGGELHALTSKDPSSPITAAAFKQGIQWKAAAVNSSGTPCEMSIAFPEESPPSSLWVLKAKSPLDTNEAKENVTIAHEPLESKDGHVAFTIPAWGLVILNDEAPLP